MKTLLVFLLSYSLATASYFGAVQPYDQSTNRYGQIDHARNMRVASQKRLVGSNMNTIDAGVYTTSTSGTGAATPGGGFTTLATGATANSAVSIVSIARARSLSGRENSFRASVRFADTGTANNVREFGIRNDASNGFYFRLSGTTFSVVLRKAGVETVVNSGSFNGNGAASNGTWTVDTNFHTFEILYFGSRIAFLIDMNAVHTFSAGSSSLVTSTVGTLYIANTNSGGSTSNVSMELLNWSAANLGDSVNNPQFYHINAVAETRTLKSGGGTLQSISVGRAGGTGATLTLYDSTTGSGTIIGIYDLTKDQMIGNHTFGIEGVNFTNGLTYVTSGTMTSGSVTILWD